MDAKPPSSRPRPATGGGGLARAAFAERGLVVCVVVAWLYLACRAFSSQGFYSEDDYAHLLISRSVLHDPSSLLDVWGRPVMTAAYAVTAHISDSAIRAESVLLLAVIAGLTMLTARAWKQPLWPLAGLLVLAQPVTDRLAFGAMTQTVFAALLAFALFLRADRKLTAALLVASFLPLARLEGVVVVAAWALVLLYERQPRRVPLLGVGVLLWAVVGAVRYGDPLWLLHANRFLTLGTPYAAAGWGYVLEAFPAVFGGITTGLVVGYLSRRHIPDRVVPVTLLALVAFYVFAWGEGAFATLDWNVYLAGLSPAVALCAHHTLTRFAERQSGFPWGEGISVTLLLLWLWQLYLVGTVDSRVRAEQSAGVLLALAVVVVGRARLPLTRSSLIRPAAAGVAVVAFAVGVAAYKAHPLPLSGNAASARLAIERLGSQADDVYTYSSPSFGYYLGHDRQPSFTTQVGDAPPGSLVLWDSFLAPESYAWPEERMLRAGFRPVSELETGGVRQVLFRRSEPPPGPRAGQ